MVLVAFVAIDFAALRDLSAYDLVYKSPTLQTALPVASVLTGAALMALPRRDDRPAYWQFAVGSATSLGLLFTVTFAWSVLFLRNEIGDLHSIPNHVLGPNNGQRAVVYIATIVLAVIMLIVPQAVLAAIPDRFLTAAGSRARGAWMTLFTLLALANAIIIHVTSLATGHEFPLVRWIGYATTLTLLSLAAVITQSQAGARPALGRTMRDVGTSLALFAAFFWSWPMLLSWYAVAIVSPMLHKPMALYTNRARLGGNLPIINYQADGVSAVAAYTAGAALLVLAYFIVPSVAIARGMRLSRHQMRQLLVFVVVAALDFGSIAGGLRQPPFAGAPQFTKPRELALIFGTLPMANLLAFLTLAALLRKGRNLALRRFVAYGAISSALFTTLTCLRPRLFSMYHEAAIGPLGNLLIHNNLLPDWPVSVAITALPAFLLMLPQVALAVVLTAFATIFSRRRHLEPVSLVQSAPSGGSSLLP
jgi:hypothetical protein